MRSNGSARTVSPRYGGSWYQVCVRPSACYGDRPLLDGKIPFPTTFHFPRSSKAISRVEASGKMAEFTALPGRALAALAVLAGLTIMANLMVPHVPAAQRYRKPRQIPGWCRLIGHKLYLIFRHHLAQKQRQRGTYFRDQWEDA